MNWPYVLLGWAFLFLGSYLDNLRGPLVPVLRETLGLNYGETSWLLVGGYLASVFFMVGFLRLFKTYSLRALGFCICLFAIGACIFSLVVHNFGSMTVLGVWLGASVTIMGGMGNVLAIHGSDESHRSRSLCGLHTMYGLGSQAGPVLAGYLWALNYPWYVPLLAISPLFLVLGLAVGIVLPQGMEKAEEQEPPSPLPFHHTAEKVSIFALYGAGEVILSTWLPTYLVASQGVSIEKATLILAAFFWTMALTRILCFFSLRPHQEEWLLKVSLGLAVVFFILGRVGWIWGFALCGLLGPCFPLLIARLGREHPRHAKALALQAILSMQVALVFCHFTLGYLTDWLGIAWVYWLPELALVGTLIKLGRQASVPQEKMLNGSTSTL